MPRDSMRLFDVERTGIIFPRKKIKRAALYILITIIGILCCIFIITFFIVPVVFKFSVELQRLLMFTSIGMSDDPLDYTSPFLGVRNLYYNFHDEVDGKISLGIWHLLPTALENETDFDKQLANSSYSVIIHFHGSGETRKDSKGMFAVLKEFFHVIAVEYRDFGDSTKALLSEEGIVRDSVQIYKWIRSITNNHIYIWGHSLGTALSTRTVSKLKSNGVVPMGVMLEAPLTSMTEEIPVHPYGKIFAWLPWFENTITRPLEKNGFHFNTSKHILDVDCPVMILHAEDDSIIPYTLGKKLATIAVNNRKPTQGNITYYQFPASYGFDHFRIYLSSELPIFIENFVEICDLYNKEKQ